MSGRLRLYDTYFYDLGRGLHTHGTDTLMLALLTSAYNPCITYGARAPLLNYVAGDVVYVAAYVCYFVAKVRGLSASGTPVFNTTPGDLTTDGTVIWVSVGLAPPSTHAVFANVSAHEAAGPGYTAGGQVVTKTHALAGGRTTLSAAPVIWGSSEVTAKYAVLYKLGTIGAVVNPLIGYVLLDDGGGSMASSTGVFRVLFGGDVVFSVGGV